MYAKRQSFSEGASGFPCADTPAEPADLSEHLSQNPEKAADRAEPELKKTRGEAWHRQKQVAAQMDELMRENRWEEIISLCHPVEKKLPELTEHQLDVKIRSALAFALGQTARYDEAIAELQICVRTFPDNFLFHTSLAYNAYNSLYAAKNRNVFLAGEARRDRIALAHVHFRKAQELRPDGVSNFYREAMLYHQIEEEQEKAMPLFMKAIANWEQLDAARRKARHQERKNYVKALYHGAGTLLKLGNAAGALEILRKCEAEDHATDYVSKMFKCFAGGKILHHLHEYEKAKDALLFALKVKGKKQSAEFVLELLGRTWLALEQPDQALKVLEFIPPNRRKPYICWTLADTFCALSRPDEARDVLSSALDRDQLSRHKTLIRLAKLEYRQGNFPRAAKHAQKADAFFREKWGNLYAEACYWQAMSASGMGDRKKAAELTCALEKHFPRDSRIPELKKIG